jgi:predicted PurR-regulated permease PerM
MDRDGSARRRAAFRYALTGMAIVFLYQVRGALMPFLFAGVIAYFLEPPVRYLVRQGFRRRGAVTLIYSISFLMLGVVIFRVFPLVLGELVRFGEAAPELFDGIRSFLDNLNARYAAFRLPPVIRSAVDEGVLNLQASGIALVRDIIEGIVRALGNVASLLLSPVLAFYTLRDYDTLRSRFLAALPGGQTGHTAGLLRDIDRALNSFIRGQAVIALIVGTLVTAVSAILGIRFALLLGLLAAAGEFIPYFGPLFALVPATLFGLIRSPLLGLQIAAGILVIQQVEAAVLAPRVLGESVGLHPLLVVFILISGGHLMGFWGLFLGVPVFVVVRLLLRFIYDEWFS